MLKGKINSRSEKRVWAAYKGSFEVEIRHVPRPQSREITERCQKREWDNGVGGYTQVLDTDKYYDALAREVITDWRGLKPELLRTMVDMESYPESDVPYSPEDAVELLKNVHGFDVWVQTIARNLDYHEAARRAAELKNS